MSSHSESFDVVTNEITVGNLIFNIRTLKDKQQYYDPAGLAENIGISSATWPLFGVLWPSALVLANKVDGMQLDNVRVLELGCGIALPGMVASTKGGDITVSDYHPLAESFLNKNIALNNLDHIHYAKGDWRKPITLLGRFDLVIASDVLYEKEHPEQLSSFINSHTTEAAIVIIVDPKRKHGNKFIKLMKAHGFNAHTEEVKSKELMESDYKGRIYTFMKF